MKTYRFPAFKGEFIFATLGNHSYLPTITEMENISVLASEYKISAKDLNKIPYVRAQSFEKIEDDKEYVFLLGRDCNLFPEDIKNWKEIFESLIDEKEQYNLILAVYGSELKRMKRNLLIFM